MPSVTERLATIEAGVRELRQAVDELRDSYNGGGDVEYSRSVRGRLHTLETTVAGFVLRRSMGLGMVKGWQGFVLVTCAIATAAAAWYSVLN